MTVDEESDANPYCEQCGKETDYVEWWEWTVDGVRHYFCSQKCLDKWFWNNKTKKVLEKKLG